MIKNAFLIYSLLFSAKVFADPQTIDVYFLSRSPSAFLQYILPGTYQTMGSVALNTADEEKKCVDMGDFCFDPQINMVENSTFVVDQEKAFKQLDEPEAPNPAKMINAVETNMIDCDKNYYFDMYCGKGKPVKSKEVKLEVWIDTSASMRGVDYHSQDGFCDRRRFVAQLQDSCGNGSGMSVSVFDTGIKEFSSLSQLCDYRGLNDGKRMVDWIKGTTTKHLIIVTDVEEYNNEFREYLDRVKANIHGIGVKPMMSASLLDDLSKMSKKCQ